MSIVVTVDGSERSWKVLPHASGLARALHSPLHLVRVLNPLLDVGDQYGPSIQDAAEQVAGRWEAELAAYLRNAGVEAETTVAIVDRKESIADAIVRVGREHEAKVIAMNSRGSGLLHHALLGSTSLGVVGKAPCPVMLAGPHLQPLAPRDGYRVMVTSDGSAAARHGCDQFAELLAGSDVDVLLAGIYSAAFGDMDPMSVMADARKHLEELRDRFGGVKHVLTRVFEAAGNESSGEAVVRSAEEAEAAVIAMSTHGHSILRHIVAGSTALTVLQHSPLPLLVVPAE